MGNLSLNDNVPKILDFAVTARKSPINFDAYSFVDAKEDMGLLRSYIGSSSEESRAVLINTSGAKFIPAFLNFLGKVSLAHTIQTLLTLLADIVNAEGLTQERVRLFHECSALTNVPSWQVFYKIIAQGTVDKFSMQQSSLILARIASGPDVMPEREFHIYLSWLVKTINTPANDDGQLLALAALQLLLRTPAYRPLAFGNEQCLNMVHRILLMEPASSIQIQYQTLCCVWVMTFNGAIATSFDNGNGPGFISEIAELLKNTRKEKVARVCLAILRNLLNTPTDTAAKKRNGATMIACKLLTQIELIAKQNNYDEDAIDDANFLLENLNAAFESMSTFDEYFAEVVSTKLTWSPVHTSDKFWRENAARLNEQDAKLIKILTVMLSSDSVTPLVTAIAAHDIGEYVRAYPAGKQMLERLAEATGGIGAKERVMQLMTHQDEAVRYEALICVQKLVTQNWVVLNNSRK